MPALSTPVAIAPFNFLRSFALQTLGHFDPTAFLTNTCLTKRFAATGGPCNVTIQAVDGGVTIACDGSDAEQVLAQLLDSIATDDGYNSFAPAHDLVAKLHREQAGLRLLRVPWLFDIVCSAVLQQRVRFMDACKDWSHIATRFGPKTRSGEAVFPDAATLASVPVHELERLGIDAKRSRTLIALAREMKLNPIRPSHTFAQIRGRLARVPGVGPWTVETVLGFGAADPDALPTGDLYLPSMVSYAFHGKAEGTDDEMIQTLAPFRGQRFRVIRLLYGAKINIPRLSPPGRRKPAEI